MAPRNEPGVLKRRFCSLNASMFKNGSFESFNEFASTSFLDSFSCTFKAQSGGEKPKAESVVATSIFAVPSIPQLVFMLP